MKKTNYFPYVILILFVLVTLSLPKNSVDKYRTFTVACFSPFWKSMFNAKKILLKAPIVSVNESTKNDSV